MHALCWKKLGFFLGGGSQDDCTHTLHYTLSVSFLFFKDLLCSFVKGNIEYANNLHSFVLSKEKAFTF